MTEKDIEDPSTEAAVVPDVNKLTRKLSHVVPEPEM